MSAAASVGVGAIARIVRASRASRCSRLGGRECAGVSDVEERFGLPVYVADAAAERVFDQCRAVVGLFETEGLVGQGAHHPSGVAVGVGLDGELVADLVVVLGCALLAEVVVFPPGR